MSVTSSTTAISGALTGNVDLQTYSQSSGSTTAEHPSTFTQVLTSVTSSVPSTVLPTGGASTIESSTKTTEFVSESTLLGEVPTSLLTSTVSETTTSPSSIFETLSVSSSATTTTSGVFTTTNIESHAFPQSTLRTTAHAFSTFLPEFSSVRPSLPSEGLPIGAASTIQGSPITVLTSTPAPLQNSTPTTLHNSTPISLPTSPASTLTISPSPTLQTHKDSSLQNSTLPNLQSTKFSTSKSTKSPSAQNITITNLPFPTDPNLQNSTTSTLKSTTTLAPNVEAQVMNAANTYLDSSVRMKRDVRMQKLSNPVSIQNITYTKTNNSSYTISFKFQISNVNISSNAEMRNETHNAIENITNSLLNKILNGKNSTPFIFPQPIFTDNKTVIEADSMYVFTAGDIKSTSAFLSEIMTVSGLTSITPAVTNAISGGGGGFPGWALAIIIPCSIAIILIPAWITLCCMLCGCCAAIRRRYSRRRSYNVQYTTRNGLF
ncbi:uncharacterized protein [Hoplias malabaricus]|uniref:uncharacterized protein isoform X2 n=1 Tax=Hoplias malabaricus TaxID=27720 RepID=UPI0034629351